MSDQEAKANNELSTRKSHRQKTPNTYYSQDISDPRIEIKQKGVKEQVPKQVVPKLKKKKTDKPKSINLSSQIYSFRQSSKSNSSEGTSQPQMKEQNDIKQENISENESDPASDAAEVSQSPCMSQKSNQNNPNTSYTDNEDFQNKANSAAAYQTRKIRKKPKFADENYIDNMPSSKAIIPKKITKSIKTQEPIRKESFSGVQEKKKEEGDFLKGGLLDIFLDAVTGVENNKDQDKEGANTSKPKIIVSEQKLTWESSGTKRQSESNSVKQEFEEGQALRKKFKREGEKSIKNDRILRENNQSERLLSQNNTVYNYPNIKQKQDYITHVDKSKDKLILHHSSFAPMEINRMYLKEEVKNRVDIPKLHEQIIKQQILLQQKEQQQSAVQKFLNTLDSSKKINSSLRGGFGSQNNQEQQMQNSQPQGMNNFLQIPQTITILQDILSRQSTQLQDQPHSILSSSSSQDKSLFLQQAILQLQGTIDPNSLSQNLLKNSAQKIRSSSQEIDSNFVQRKLSEHFKISRNDSSAVEEEIEKKRKLAKEESHKLKEQQRKEVESAKALNESSKIIEEKQQQQQQQVEDANKINSMEIEYQNHEVKEGDDKQSTTDKDLNQNEVGVEQKVLKEKELIKAEQNVADDLQIKSESRMEEQQNQIELESNKEEVLKAEKDQPEEIQLEKNNKEQEEEQQQQQQQQQQLQLQQQSQQELTHSNNMNEEQDSSLKKETEIDKKEQICEAK